MIPSRVQAEGFDGLTADQMLLNDLFQDRFSARMVPNAIGPHDCDRPRYTNLQAIGLRALHTSTARPLGPQQPQFLEAALKVLPSAVSGVAVAALLLLGKAAQEQVSFDGIAANLGERAFRLAGLY